MDPNALQVEIVRGALDKLPVYTALGGVVVGGFIGIGISWVNRHWQRKDRTLEKVADAKATFTAIVREFTGFWEQYERTHGEQLASLEGRKPYESYGEFPADIFVVYRSNTQAMSFLPAPKAAALVTTFNALQVLITAHKKNDTLFEEMEAIYKQMERRPSDPIVVDKEALQRTVMGKFSPRLKGAYQEAEHKMAELVKLSEED